MEPEIVDQAPGGSLRLKPEFALTIIVGIVSLVSFFIYMRAELTSLRAENTQTQRDIKELQTQNLEMRMNMITLQDNIKYFREAYERDMNKYIRDNPRRN